MGDAYRLLFDANPVPMWVVDRDTGRYLAVNDAAARKLGRARDELVGAEAGAAEGEPIEFEGRAAVLVVDRSAERRLRAIVDSTADGIALVSKDGITRWVNGAVERILGRPANTIVGHPATALNHPDDEKAVKAPPRGETKIFLRRSRHIDGTWRWLESVVSNKLDDPDVGAYITNVRDVTERVEAEEAARRSEASFRTLIERSPSAVFVHRGGKIVYANPACVTLFGYERADELLGRSPLDLVHPDDHADISQRMATTTSVGHSPPRLARLLRKDGRVLVCECEGVHLDWGGALANVVLARDLTERHELFARLALADRMVTVGTLAAGVAHEINNPLAFVMTSLALLEERRDALAPDEIAQLLRDARDGAARVAAIVRDLKTLSRADEDAREPIDVRDVLALSIKMAQSELRHKARLAVDLAPDLPLVVADESRLGQVFLNLLVNAAQAIPSGHAEENEIRVRARGEGDLVVIEVEDTGAGIPPNVLGRIFDPFFTTKPAGVGTGLGLAICHGIVRRLGGEITVTSAKDRGTCFRVALPRARAERAPARPPSEPPREQRARILFVDDEASLGNSVRLLLSREHDVVPVTTARRALEMITHGDRFDLILCDVMMPEMGGIELHAELAAVAPEYLARTIFLTGGAFTEEAHDFLERVPNPPIEKPFTESDLRGAIARTLSRAARNQTRASS